MVVKRKTGAKTRGTNTKEGKERRLSGRTQRAGPTRGEEEAPLQRTVRSGFVLFG